MLKHFNVRISGKVQGVFYRAAAQQEAFRLGLRGFVRNEPNGDVYIEAEGPSEQLTALVSWCHTGPPNAIVLEVHVVEAEQGLYTVFEIRR